MIFYKYLYKLTFPDTHTHTHNPHQRQCHQIGLEDFLRLFLNHRPARGEDTAQLEKVFKVKLLFIKTFQSIYYLPLFDVKQLQRPILKVIGKEQMEDPNEVPDISRW